jgi:hypothetical protein
VCIKSWKNSPLGSNVLLQRLGRHPWRLILILWRLMTSSLLWRSIRTHERTRKHNSAKQCSRKCELHDAQISTKGFTRGMTVQTLYRGGEPTVHIQKQCPPIFVILPSHRFEQETKFKICLWPRWLIDPFSGRSLQQISTPSVEPRICCGTLIGLCAGLCLLMEGRV